MTILARPQLANELRRICDSVRNRLWIASPYVGSWRVRSVLGRAWWDRNKIDLRLLTDPDERPLNRNTALRFAEKGKIKKLRGLHAKLYIVDDRALVTSANLTFAAFARRHEAGVVLQGRAAQSAVTLFESWWDSATDFSKEDVLRLPRRQLHTAGEDDTPGLPAPMELPPYPGDFGGEGFISTFGDYPDFLRCYKQMAAVYASLTRVWPEIPLYLETDAFLDYLYHHEKQPSKPFTRMPSRRLTVRRQVSEIRKYRVKFQLWARDREEDRKWRFTNANAIHRLLSPSNIVRLGRPEIRDVASRLNCMNDGRVLARFLGDPRNSTRKVRKAWDKLLHGNLKAFPTDEMTECASLLYGFKRSSVQELLGWYSPKRFPLRNRNVNAGLRFLGYDVRPL